MSDDPIELGTPTRTFTRPAMTPLGCHDVRTPQGVVHFCEGNGLFTSIVLGDDEAPISGALMAYIDGTEDKKGRGVVIQLDAGAMREIAASLLAKADQLDPVKPN